MALKINQNNKNTIEKMHLLTGKSKDDTKRFFEAFAFLLATDYLEGEWTNLPFFGDIKVHHTGDVPSDKGVRAQLELEFEPEDSLIKTIGQLVDGEKSEVEKTFMNRVRSSLHSYISQE